MKVKAIDNRHRNIFEIVFSDNTKITSRKILLATGIEDILPNIKGMSHLWGKAVLNCPYCHGWEVKDQPIAVYGNDQETFERACMLYNWSRDIIVCSNGPSQMKDTDRIILASKNIAIYEQQIDCLEYSANKLERIIFTDGSSVKRDIIFLKPKQQQRSNLPFQLGCDFTKTGKIKVKGNYETTIHGVYAAGDAIRDLQQIIIAASDGAIAAININHDIIMEDNTPH